MLDGGHRAGSDDHSASAVAEQGVDD